MKNDCNVIVSLMMYDTARKKMADCTHAVSWPGFLRLDFAYHLRKESSSDAPDPLSAHK